MFSLNSETRIVAIAEQGLEPATSCVRDQDANTVSARHVRHKIFKLSPVHGSVEFFRNAQE